MRRLGALGVAWVALISTGCATGMTAARCPNPITVPAEDFETIWTRTVHVVDQYFEIAEENRIDGRIKTIPQPSATLFEPWHADSVGFASRLEATLQSMRRRAVVQVRPAANGYEIQVEVINELEDLPTPERASAADVTFRKEFPLAREYQVVGPLALPQGWILKGRDVKLEQRILSDLRKAFADGRSGP